MARNPSRLPGAVRTVAADLAAVDPSAYRTAIGQNLRRGLLVARADVTHLMLAVLDRPETIGQTVGIAN